MPDESPQEISREALYEQRAERLTASRITVPPAALRLSAAAIGGIFLLIAQAGAPWAWIGAGFVMLSLVGAAGPLGALAGAIAASIAYFRVIEFTDPSGVFWVLLLFQAGGGALFGALASEISRKLPPVVFAPLAALLPAGLEHLGSFIGHGNFLSTALTQYSWPTVVRIARLGGMSGVTWVIFCFGGAAAIAVRYAKVPEVLVKATLPAVGIVVAALIYGAASSSAGGESLFAVAYAPEILLKETDALAARGVYDSPEWRGQISRLADEMLRISERSLAARAIDRLREPAKPDVVVWPEASIMLDASLREDFLDRIGEIMRQTSCVQVFGYYDVEEMASRAVITAGHQIGPNYARRAYVPERDDIFTAQQIAQPGLEWPWAESTPKGRMGALLSLDANNFSNFRRLADDGAVFVGVPALDDTMTPQASLRLLVYNAALSGLAVVRAPRNGTLAAVSPDGKIIASEETLDQVSVQLPVSVEVGTGRTIFLLVGNAFAWISLLGGLAVGFYASSLQEPPEDQARRSEAEVTGQLTYRTNNGMRGL